MMLHGSNDKKPGTSCCFTGRAMSYGYDDIGQLTQVDASRPSDAARYAYDATGNPVRRAELGFEVTNAFNNLNQILSGTWTGGTITAVGTVNYPGGAVSVGGARGTIYPDKTFDAAGVPVSLGANTLTNVFTDPYGRSATNTTSVTITNRAYAHDLNGNLTSDGVFTYQYDSANQLTNVIRLADNIRILSCRYDALGRRVEAIRADGTTDRYVYFPGSFLVLAVLDENNDPKELYTRGPDLSGSLDSAGGIGGILACTSASGPVLSPHADLMGNVIALTDVSGIVASTFRYTPFGQLVERTGTVSSRYLFSSKELDGSVNLYYYGYRHYSPSLVCWVERDPLANYAKTGSYNFVNNNAVLFVDAIGLQPTEPIVIANSAMALAYWRSNLGGETSASQEIVADVRDEGKYWKFISDLSQRDATCGSSDEFKLKDQQSYTFQTYNDAIGRIQVAASGHCSWKCEACIGRIGLNACTCTCSVECDLDLSFDDTYDFTPHPTDPWLKQLSDIVDGWVAGSGTPYHIIGKWTEHYRNTFLTLCSKDLL